MTTFCVVIIGARSLTDAYRDSENVPRTPLPINGESLHKNGNVDSCRPTDLISRHLKHSLADELDEGCRAWDGWIPRSHVPTNPTSLVSASARARGPLAL